MTSAPTRSGVRTVDDRSAPAVAAFLERPGPGEEPLDAVLAHQLLLDALDRGERQRLLMWPGDEPRAVGHLSATGTLVVAGDAAAGDAIARHVEGGGWRVLLGDAPLAQRILDVSGHALLRRRPRAREQRFMVTRAPADLDAPVGLRRARADDLDAVSDQACRLHVEDRMGPPLSRSARAGVTERMRESILRGATWVVERDVVVAKVDVSLASRRRGAQIAGVYVEHAWRGRGLATRAVAAISRQLIADGFPGVTLHVRADNSSGRAAYAKAGFVDYAAWILALR